MKSSTCLYFFQRILNVADLFVFAKTVVISILVCYSTIKILDIIHHPVFYLKTTFQILDSVSVFRPIDLLCYSLRKKS
jgi:hypothetical protein